MYELDTGAIEMENVENKRICKTKDKKKILYRKGKRNNENYEIKCGGIRRNNKILKWETNNKSETFASCYWCVT